MFAGLRKFLPSMPLFDKVLHSTGLTAPYAVLYQKVVMADIIRVKKQISILFATQPCWMIESLAAELKYSIPSVRRFLVTVGYLSSFTHNGTSYCGQTTTSSIRTRFSCTTTAGRNFSLDTGRIYPQPPSQFHAVSRNNQEGQKSFRRS